MSAAALAGLIVCLLFLQRGVEQYGVQRQTFKTYPTNRENPDWTTTVIYEGPTPWHLLGPAIGIGAAAGVLVALAFGKRLALLGIWLLLCAAVVGLWARSQRTRDYAVWHRYQMKGDGLHDASVSVASVKGGLSVNIGKQVFLDGPVGSRNRKVIESSLALPNPMLYWARHRHPSSLKYPALAAAASPYRVLKGGFAYHRQTGSQPPFKLSFDSTRFVAPHWALGAPLAVPPLLWGLGMWRRWRRTRRGLCAACGYDLRESRDRCPECGKPIPPRRPGRRLDALRFRGTRTQPPQGPQPQEKPR